MPEAANLLYGPLKYLKIGPYGTAIGSCTDIGFADGGVTITPKYTIDKRPVDQRRGSVAANMKEVAFTLKITLAEITIPNLATAFSLPASAINGSTLNVGSNIDVQYYTAYLQGPGPNGATRNITVQKCYLDGPGAIEMDKKKATLAITLELLEDVTQPVGQEWMIITDASGATTAPTVSSRTPANSATNVPNATAPTIVFSEAIQGADVNGTYFKLMKQSDGSTVAGTLVLSGDKLTVTFTPTAALSPSTPYLWMVSKGVRDMAGNVLAADSVSLFTTAAS